MTGKVCLITGATAGIGEAAARALARMGATVIVAGRDSAKTQGVVDRLRGETGNSRIEPIVADLSIQSEVSRMAREFRSRFPRLDVLLNNAGAYYAKRRESAEAIEMTFALNQLAYFLLTHELLDLLKASEPARIINVSSDAHRGAKLDWLNIQLRKGYGGFRAYCNSKLANLYFTFELARMLERQNAKVTVNAMHPGFVASQFGLQTGGAGFRIFRKLADRLFALTPEQGASTAVYLASSPEVEGVSGKYFYKSRAIEPTKTALDANSARRMWAICEELTRTRWS